MIAQRHGSGAPVRVHRLSAQLPPGGSWSASAITHALDRAPWPDTGGEIWRIRHLRVRLPAGTGPAALGAASVAALHDGLRRGEVVRFASHDQRAAELSAALASGRAAQEWWWEAEPALAAGDTAAAIAEVWCERPAELPRVISRLIAMGALTAVWRRLDEPAVQRILVALAAAGRLAADHPALRPAQEPASRHQAEARSPSLAAGAPVTAAWPAAVLAPWRTLLATLPADDHRRNLIAVLVAGRLQPRSLQQAPAVAEWTVLVRSLAAPDAPMPVGTTIAPVPSTPAESVPSEAAMDAVPPPAEDGWWSWQTIASDHLGIVHLLSALRHPVLAALAPAPDFHLWRAWALRRGLPPDDPLAWWFESLLRDPPLAVEQAEALAVSVAALDDAALALHGDGIWNRRLIDARGCLRCDPTHLIVHLPLHGVRLDLRQAGLDLDPGWIPSLGRVVHIAYHATDLPGPSPTGSPP
jgi:hypothetical protein